MPTVRQPLIRAICPTTLPTAPAAPDTTTVWPGSGRPTSSSPKYAVNPVIPSTPR